MQDTQSVDRPHRSTTRIVIIARHRLDCDALTSLLHDCDRCQVLCATTVADDAWEVCRRERPHVVLLDATLVDRDHRYDLTSYLPAETLPPILLLDNSVHLQRLGGALKLPVAGYVTRNVSGEELAEAIGQLMAGRSTFDAAASEAVHHTSRGWQLRTRQHDSPLSRLTAREIDVLRLIALGNTVRQCADMLQLAPSTVDNHKSRLMKKLGLHKTTELVRFAVREGLIRD